MIHRSLSGRKLVGGTAWLEQQFRLAERNSTPGRELRAAAATFVVLAYIISANPIRVLHSTRGPGQASADTSFIKNTQFGERSYSVPRGVFDAFDCPKFGQPDRTSVMAPLVRSVINPTFNHKSSSGSNSTGRFPGATIN